VAADIGGLAYRFSLLSRIVTNDNRYVNSAGKHAHRRRGRSPRPVPDGLHPAHIPRPRSPAPRSGEQRLPGRTAEATTLHEQTLAGRERILGPGHPGTLTARNGPTVACQDTGRTAEAKDLNDQPSEPQISAQACFTRRSREPISRFCRHHGPHCQPPVGTPNGGSASVLPDPPRHSA